MLFADQMQRARSEINDALGVPQQMLPQVLPPGGQAPIPLQANVFAPGAPLGANMPAGMPNQAALRAALAAQAQQQGPQQTPWQSAYGAQSPWQRSFQGQLPPSAQGQTPPGLNPAILEMLARRGQNPMLSMMAARQNVAPPTISMPQMPGPDRFAVMRQP
jgi:hypothetical protein